MKYLALIPLRGGSLSIPRKNIKPLAGRPLCDWAIKSALDSGIFSEVWVSTDDQEIADVASASGAKVHWRDEKTATAEASTESVMMDFLKSHSDFEVLSLIQATSPLTLPEHLRAARTKFEKNEADSLVTVTKEHRFSWSEDGKPLNYDPCNRPRRQDWDGMLLENGAFYFVRKALLTETGCRLGGRIIVFEMPRPTSYEIDEPEDWVVLEQLAKRHGHQPSQ